MLKQTAFTVIELVFVIVVLGVLGAVAMIGLNATRNDATIVAETKSAAQALHNLGVEWTAQNAWNGYTVDMANDAVHCFVFTATLDGNVTIASLDSANNDCLATVLEGAKTLAAQNGLLLPDKTQKLYQFAGKAVAR